MWHLGRSNSQNTPHTPAAAHLHSHMAGLILSVAVLLAVVPCALAQYQQMATFFGGAPDGMDPSQPSFGLLDVSLCNPPVIVSKTSWHQAQACAWPSKV